MDAKLLSAKSPTAAIPKWAIPASAASFGALIVLLPWMMSHEDWNQTYSVAFVGNSMQYYNDLPRFLEEISAGHVEQNSCLHGDATVVNLLQTGNGMYSKFHTGNARIDSDRGDTKLYDYGACSVHMLLFGWDDYTGEYNDGTNLSSVTDDYTGVYDDGTNPCYEDGDYLEYISETLLESTPLWDFILINDNTRSPARNTSRLESLATLNSTYVRWFTETGAVPVFLDTHAYWTSWRNMDGLDDVPTFTSLTYEGYRQYAELLGEQLPRAQQPRIAPVGIAFLTVWEENYSLWLKLFHYDEVHASPSGSYLTGCIIYHTLFGRMPSRSVAIRDNMSWLFRRARRMQPPAHRSKPYPTRDEAAFLYRVAERVTKEGHIPKSFTYYQNGESAPDASDDDVYQ